jgi:hypothetical protein
LVQRLARHESNGFGLEPKPLGLSPKLMDAIDCHQNRNKASVSCSLPVVWRTRQSSSASVAARILPSSRGTISVMRCTGQTGQRMHVEDYGSPWTRPHSLDRTATSCLQRLNRARDVNHSSLRDDTVRKSSPNSSGITLVGKTVLEVRPNLGVKGPQPLFKVVRSKVQKGASLLGDASGRREPRTRPSVFIGAKPRI